MYYNNYNLLLITYFFTRLIPPTKIDLTIHYDFVIIYMIMTYRKYMREKLYIVTLQNKKICYLYCFIFRNCIYIYIYLEMFCI